MSLELYSRLKMLGKRETWELKPEPSTFAPSGSLSNKDMDPVPPGQRTWTSLNFVLYWISTASNIAVWELASSMLAVGLSWKQALPAIALGQVIIGVAMVATGTIGARLHIAFPVLMRSSFGFWFSYFSVISRVVLSLFWYSIQTYAGGESVYQMLKAIWPSLARMHNQLPPGANITTAKMLCYAIYWLIQFPFMLVPPQKIRWLFVTKGIIVPISWMAVLIWSFVKVPTSESLFAQSSNLSGSSLIWAWLSAMNTSIGINSTLAVNIMDFTRYAKADKDQYVQALLVPVAHTLCAFVGIAVTSAGASLYGAILWDPLTLIDRWDNRPAAFFMSFAFALAAIGTNVSANSVGAGNDMTALWPKYINIRRGQVICAIIGGWALCPWEILATASGFLAFMASLMPCSIIDPTITRCLPQSGYSVVLGPIAGVMVTDYWFVHREKLDVPEMYSPRGRYRYSYGVNWRAALAMLISIPPNMPGLINSINMNVRVGNVVHIFDVAWLFGFFSASIVYYVASVLFPARETILDTSVDGASENDDRSVEEIPVDTGLNKRSSSDEKV
ncbi:hypothetical protein ACEPAH_2290 [Sanghuangporus vaninii]